MSLAILMALIAGALCLGMLSALIPLGSGRDEDDGALGYEDEFLDVGGPVIEMEPTR